MPQNTSEFHLATATGARERLAQTHPHITGRKPFIVRYIMEGVLRIEAADAFEATRIAERYSEHELAERAELEIMEPVEAAPLKVGR